jgi:hypothetical protein
MVKNRRDIYVIARKCFFRGQPLHKVSTTQNRGLKASLELYEICVEKEKVFNGGEVLNFCVCLRPIPLFFVLSSLYL